MNNNTTNPIKIHELLLRLIEGDINDAGLNELKEWFGEADAMPAYWEFVKNYTAIKLFEESQIAASPERDELDDSINMEFWTALANDEKNAPLIQMPSCSSKTAEHNITPVEVQQASRNISKFSIYTLILSSAALLFFVIYARFAPVKRGYQVATLLDSINAKWAESDSSMKAGARLVTGGTYSFLRGGFAQLLFDNNAMVTIEGPAEFEIVSEDRIKLQYGRIYSIVPQEALGFSVATPNAMVIDLGTEFGIQVDLEGNTELHVSQGMTRLMAGINKKKVSSEIYEGSARKITGSSSEVSEVPCKDSIFVRKINSKTNLIWRGQKELDLADIVGGGNGWGTGQLETSIDPVTGKRGIYQGLDREGNGQYVLLGSDKYIDGVFVPQGSTPQIVSSRGHLFHECPVTNNIFFAEIVNGSGRLLALRINDRASNQLAGEIYGTSDCPAIFMHANLGITFDLNAIREDLPQGTVTRFTSAAGLSSDITRPGNADIWVLVDGQVRYKARVNDPQKAVQVDVPLSGTDRFLTLVTTDGGDVDRVDVMSGRATDSDWCVFVRPRLSLWSVEKD